MNKLFRWSFLLGLPLIALAVGAWGISYSLATPAPVDTEPPSTPAKSTFAAQVGGLGIIEPRGEVIDVGVQEPGTVVGVFVEPGDTIQADAPLIEIDHEVQTARLEVAEASVDVARAQVSSAESTANAAAADVVAAEARLADAELTRRRLEAMADTRSASQDEIDAARLAVQVAEANLQQTQARKLQADADVDVSRQRVSQSEAQVHEARALLDRFTVTSPIAGTVLAVDIRLGEFAPAGIQTEPLMQLGDLSTLHVRVSVDETLAARVRPDAKAVGYLRGLADVEFPLTYIFREPLAVRKQNLTGGQTELIDTRVIEFVYRVDTTDPRLVTGSQMDVFIEVE
ncbi:MAG: efflux RND transporter periplasmic adaptor subunit [Planctomycetota bacterium]